VGSIRRGEELGHYELVAYVVMANHVHLAQDCAGSLAEIA
jgi:hypothetical protein